MKRLHSLLTLAPALTLLACGDADPPESGAAAAPDVVIFLIDTLRADRTGPGGAADALTPVMNQLAEEGVVFGQAHAAGPWTLPSIMSLFTGRHLAEHNVAQEKVALAESMPILPQLLTDVGYRCVNYHRNAFAGEKFGLDRGFEICKYIKGGGIDGRALDPVFDQISSPYFLYVHNAEPHDPDTSFRPHAKRFDPVSDEFLKEYRQLVKRYRKLTRADWVKKLPLGSTDNSAEQEKAMSRLTELQQQVDTIYAGSVSVADMRVGSVIDKIKQRGRWDQTLFIVVSDHGEEMSDHGGWQHDQSVYQELLHVPLIVRFPGGEFAGTRVDTPVSLVDLVPTILDYVGCEAEGVRLSGQSLMPLVRGEPAAEGPRLVGMRDNQRKFYRLYKKVRGDLNLAVRDGRWKAILNVELSSLELYDLEADPGEQRDLAAREVELADRLARFAAERYATLLQNSERAQAGGLQEGDDETLRALQAMGYLGDDDEPDDDGE